jgi:purine-binding chemotaxis protein CheW
MNFDIADYSYSRQRAGAAVAQSRFFTIRVRGQTIGLPVDCVKTVFHVDNLTSVPLAPPEVAGLVNLRGRIVTALYLDLCLWPGSTPAGSRDGLAVGIEHGGEDYALFVEGTEDVVATVDDDRVACPAHVDARLAALVAACYRNGDDFLSVLDVDAVLKRVAHSAAARLQKDKTGISRKGANA